jgi:hypothetical protein
MSAPRDKTGRHAWLHDDRLTGLYPVLAFVAGCLLGAVARGDLP